MLKMRIIPCLDVKDGRVVKGVNFVDLVDAGDPVEQARVYDAAGADELCFLDITASSDDRAILYDVVSRTAEAVFMPLTVGGGVRTLDDIRRLLLAGADKVSINTAAVHRPDFVREAAEKFGSQCIVVAVDAKAVGKGADGGAKFEIFTHGGRKATGLDAVDWSRRLCDLGAGEISVMARVTAPMIMPALVAAFLLSVTFSWDEFIIAFLLTRFDVTLPVEIWSLLRSGLSPRLNALGSLVFLVSVTAVIFLELFVFRKRRA